MKHVLLLTGWMALFAAASAQVSYTDSINAWHQQRIADLKKENGWLNLAGLFWLKPGINSFGSSDSADVSFPNSHLSKVAGYFKWEDSLVHLHVNGTDPVTINGIRVYDTVMFNLSAGQSLVGSFESLRWTIIKREDRVGIRLRDLNSRKVSEFHGIHRFPVQEAYRIQARFIPAADKYITITNVLGQKTPQRSPGQLQFELNGQQYTLDPLQEGDALFIIFGDGTSGKSTYPSGRFLIAEKPDAQGFTVLDFNKAYNPPCAFTAFATCPLPPRQNWLPVSVKAGEQFSGH